LIVLTLTSAASAYRAAAAGHVGLTAFVAVSYSTLLLLFRRLRAYERLPPGGEADQRARLRREVWALCTLLTVLFAWKVAGVVPWPTTGPVSYTHLDVYKSPSYTRYFVVQIIIIWQFGVPTMEIYVAIDSLLGIYAVSYTHLVDEQ
ncbi:hypothetical protein BAE44_0020684, partial [Dichanthelium oligosanthes]